MKKLRKLMAGLAAVLSLGSISGGAQNVFAASGKDLRIFLGNEELQGQSLGSKPRQKLPLLWETTSIYTLQVKGDIPKTNDEGAYAENPLDQNDNRQVIPKALAKYLEAHKVFALGNGLLCTLSGEIITYKDVFGRLCPDIPIIADRNGENDPWTVKVWKKSGKNGKAIDAIISRNLHMLADKDDRKDMRVDREGRLYSIGSKSYVLLDADGNGYECVDKNQATEIDNDTMGLEVYDPEQQQENQQQGQMAQEEQQQDESQGTTQQQQQQQQQNDGTKKDNSMSVGKKAFIGAAVAAGLGGTGFGVHKGVQHYRGKSVGAKTKKDKSNIKIKDRQVKSEEKVDNPGKAF